MKTSIFTVEPTPNERFRLSVLRRVARAISETLRETRTPHALMGGTALVLAHGLPRPTTDLDFRIEVHDFGTRLTERAFTKTPGLSYREPTQDQWHKGIEGIVVREEASGCETNVGIDLVSHPLGPDDPQRIDPAMVERVDGVDTFVLSHLARCKAYALVGEHPRQQPRDLLDLTWLMSNHPQAVPPAQRAQLWKWTVRTATNEAALAHWHERFAHDDVGRRSDLGVILGHLAADLGRDVRERRREATAGLARHVRTIAAAADEQIGRMEQPALHAAVDEGTRLVLLASDRTQPRGSRRVLARSLTAREVAQIEMVLTQTDPEDVPQRERTLENERQRRIERAKGR